MDHLNAYMSEMNIPHAMRLRLRDYFMHCKIQHRQKYYHAVLEKMSPALRNEFACICHRPWINTVYFL